MYNPFALRLTRAIARLEKIEQQQRRLDRNLIPGTFITGNSGVPASRRRRLDRQLDKTLDLASEMVNLRQQVDWLQSRYTLFDEGKINANGSPRRNKPPTKKRVLSDRQKQLKDFTEQIAIYGHAQLPSGHYVSAHWSWDELAKTLRGLIRVINPDSSPTLYYTSACGAAIEDQSVGIVSQLLENK